MIAGDDVIPLEEEEEEHEESMDDVHHHLEPFPPSIPNRVSSTASSPELFSRAYSRKAGVLGDVDVDADAGPAALAVYPSPSGDFVACFWIHRRYVVIYHCSSGVEADQGPCLLFGWVGREDSYLLKTPGRVTAAAAGHEKASKRASVRDLFVVSSSIKDKEKTAMLHASSPELVLRRCIVGSTSTSGDDDDDDDESRRLVVRTSNLRIAASSASSSSSVVKSTSGSLFQSSSVYELLQQHHFTSDSVINIIGGSLVNVTSYCSSNSINSNSNTSGQAAAAAHKRSGDSTTVVDSSSSSSATTQPPPPHHRATTSRFYTLVSNKWLRTRLRVEASLALSRDLERQQARRGRRGSSVVTATTTTATTSTTTTTKTPVVMMVDELSDCGIQGDDSDLQFLAVGPSIPYHPEMIR